MAVKSYTLALFVLFFFINLLNLCGGADDEDLGGSFIFGDSLVDAGNNNYLPTLSKANIRPNGIDFSNNNGNPTGRYTNGRTIGDIVGLSSVPPIAYDFFFFRFLPVSEELWDRRRAGSTKLCCPLFGPELHRKSNTVWSELCFRRRRNFERNWKNICEHSY